MAAVTATCSKCGTEHEFSVPDDHDGTLLYWECPAMVETPDPSSPDGKSMQPCSTKNALPGKDPAQLIHERALAEAQPGLDTMVITDGDVGSAKDINL